MIRVDDASLATVLEDDAIDADALLRARAARADADHIGEPSNGYFGLAIASLRGFVGYSWGTYGVSPLNGSDIGAITEGWVTPIATVQNTSGLHWSSDSSEVVIMSDDHCYKSQFHYDEYALIECVVTVDLGGSFFCQDADAPWSGIFVDLSL